MSFKRDCNEFDHPAMHENMCGGKSGTDLENCSHGECPTDDNFDGVGFGCRSDTRFMNAKDFVCTNLIRVRNPPVA